MFLLLIIMWEKTQNIRWPEENFCQFRILLKRSTTHSCVIIFWGFCLFVFLFDKAIKGKAHSTLTFFFFQLARITHCLLFLAPCEFPKAGLNKGLASIWSHLSQAWGCFPGLSKSSSWFSSNIIIIPLLNMTTFLNPSSFTLRAPVQGRAGALVNRAERSPELLLLLLLGN